MWVQKLGTNLLGHDFLGEPVPYAGSINPEKTLITLVPEETLEENKQYYVILKGELIKSYTGNIIQYDEECYFTTGIMTRLHENHL